MIRQRENDVLKFIELEQAAQHELELLKKQDNLQKKQLEKEKQKYLREDVEIYQQKINSLELTFSKLKSCIPGMDSVEEIVPYLTNIQ